MSKPQHLQQTVANTILIINISNSNNIKILTNPCAQSLNESLALGPNVSSQICIKLLPT